MPKKVKVESCRIQREYHKGKTRLTCRTHDWATRWLDNVEAQRARARHEQAVWNAARREGA